MTTPSTGPTASPFATPTTTPATPSPATALQTAQNLQSKTGVLADLLAAAEPHLAGWRSRIVPGTPPTTLFRVELSRPRDAKGAMDLSLDPLPVAKALLKTATRVGTRWEGDFGPNNEFKLVILNATTPAPNKEPINLGA